MYQGFTTNTLDTATVLDLLAIVVPDRPAKAGWEIDVNELLILKKELELQYPLHIRYSGNAKYRRGTHYARKGGWAGYYHRIVLDHHKSAESANTTLLHEVAHARQCELVERVKQIPITEFYSKVYKREGVSGQAYYENRWEVNARAFAEEYQDRKVIS